MNRNQACCRGILVKLYLMVDEAVNCHGRRTEYSCCCGNPSSIIGLGVIYWRRDAKTCLG